MYSSTSSTAATVVRPSPHPPRAGKDTSDKRLIEWSFDISMNGLFIPFQSRVSYVLESIYVSNLATNTPSILKLASSAALGGIVCLMLIDDAPRGSAISHQVELNGDNMMLIGMADPGVDCRLVIRDEIFTTPLKAPPLSISWHWDAQGLSMDPNKGNGGSTFIPCDLVTTASLEMEFQNNPQRPPFDLEIQCRKYEININTLTQRSKQTGMKRRLRRIVDNFFVASIGQKTLATTSQTMTQKAEFYQNMSQWVAVGVADVDKDETCSICCDQFSTTHTGTDPDREIVRLSKCVGHHFHVECAVGMLENKPKCGMCGAFYNVPIGTCPNGTMIHSVERSTNIPGHAPTGCIVINYHIPDGIQGVQHPSPGTQYRGTTRTAYLPNTPEGFRLFHLLSKAFARRLTFAVGQSLTTGASNCVVWTTIHHKTVISGSPFGYPDDDYLDRVRKELEGLGIL